MSHTWRKKVKETSPLYPGPFRLLHCSPTVSLLQSTRTATPSTSSGFDLTQPAFYLLHLRVDNNERVSGYCYPGVLMKFVFPIFNLQFPCSLPSPHFSSYAARTIPPSLLLSCTVHTRVSTIPPTFTLLSPPPPNRTT